MQHRLHQGLALMAGGDDGDVIVETILAAARGTGADVDEGSYLEPFLEAYVQVRLYIVRVLLGNTVIIDNPTGLW